MAQALDFIVRRFQELIGNENHLNLELGFQFGDFGALLIEKISGDINRHLHVNGGGVFLHRFFLYHSQRVQGRRFHIANDTRAITAWASHVRAFIQRGAQT